MLCTCGKTLSELIGGMEEAFPCSGEINRKVTDSKAVLARLKKKYKDGKLNFVYLEDEIGGFAVHLVSK